MNSLDIQKYESADLLFERKFFKESIMIYWHVTRDSIFDILFKKGIEFNSTGEALMNIALVLVDNAGLTEDIFFMESIATLAEWDGNFNMSYDEAIYVRELCLNLNQKLVKYV